MSNAPEVLRPEQNFFRRENAKARIWIGWLSNLEFRDRFVEKHQFTLLSPVAIQKISQMQRTEQIWQYFQTGFFEDQAIFFEQYGLAYLRYLQNVPSEPIQPLQVAEHPQRDETTRYPLDVFQLAKTTQDIFYTYLKMVEEECRTERNSDRAIYLNQELQFWESQASQCNAQPDLAFLSLTFWRCFSRGKWRSQFR